MNFTFDCILLKDNKAVREDVVLTLDDAPNICKEVIELQNNSIEWLEKTGIEGLKKTLLNSTFKESYNYEELNPYWLDFKEKHTKDNHYSIDNKDEFDYLLKQNHNIISKYFDWIERQNETKEYLEFKKNYESINNFELLDKSVFDKIALNLYNDLHFNFTWNLDNLKKKTFEILQKLIISKIDYVIFQNHNYPMQLFDLNDIKFIYFYANQLSYIKINGENIFESAGNDEKNNFYNSIRESRFPSPFKDFNSLLDQINLCLKDKTKYKKDLISAQINLLAFVLDREVNLIDSITDKIIPNLILEKNKLLKSLSDEMYRLKENAKKEFEKGLIEKQNEIVKDNIEIIFLNEKINEINLEISKYTAPTNYKSSIEYTNISIFEKLQKTELIKIKILFWKKLINAQ